MLKIGDTFSFSKTVSESDIYLFAGITGDFHPNHVNEEYMKNSIYGKRIMHGALGIGFMSTISAQALETQSSRAVSAGYDHVRFIRPVFIGDTITCTYTVESIDYDKLKHIADVKLFRNGGELCTVAKHIVKYFEDNVTCSES